MPVGRLDRRLIGAGASLTEWRAEVEANIAAGSPNLPRYGGNQATVVAALAVVNGLYQEGWGAAERLAGAEAVAAQHNGGHGRYRFKPGVVEFRKVHNLAAKILELQSENTPVNRTALMMLCAISVKEVGWTADNGCKIKLWQPKLAVELYDDCIQDKDGRPVTPAAAAVSFQKVAVAVAGLTGEEKDNKSKAEMSAVDRTAPHLDHMSYVIPGNQDLDLMPAVSKPGIAGTPLGRLYIGGAGWVGPGIIAFKKCYGARHFGSEDYASTLGYGPVLLYDVRGGLPWGMSMARDVFGRTEYTKGILLPDGTIGQSTTNVDPRVGAPAAAIDTGLGRTNIGPIITAGVGFTMVNGYPAMHNGESMYAQDWAFLTQAMLATSAAARRYSYEHGAHAAETFAVETFSGTTAGGRAEILTAMGSSTEDYLAVDPATGRVQQDQFVFLPRGFAPGTDKSSGQQLSPSFNVTAADGTSCPAFEPATTAFLRAESRSRHVTAHPKDECDKWKARFLLEGNQALKAFVGRVGPHFDRLTADDAEANEDDILSNANPEVLRLVTEQAAGKPAAHMDILGDDVIWGTLIGGPVSTEFLIRWHVKLLADRDEEFPDPFAGVRVHLHPRDGFRLRELLKLGSVAALLAIFPKHGAAIRTFKEKAKLATTEARLDTILAATVGTGQNDDGTWVAAVLGLPAAKLALLAEKLGLSDDEAAALEVASTHPSTINWNTNYALLKKFVEQDGKLPMQTQTIDHGDGEVANIGIWLHRQKSNFHTLAPDRRELLEALNGFEWPKKKPRKEDAWNTNYAMLQKIVEQGGTLPTKRQTIVGDDGEVTQIGGWLHTQKSNFRTRTPERRKLLEALNGFAWSKKRKKQNEKMNSKQPAKKMKKKNNKKKKKPTAQEKARDGGSVGAGVAKPRPRGHPGGKESKKFRAITLTETFEEEAMHEETMSGEEVTVADFRGLDSNLVDLDQPPPPPPPEKSAAFLANMAMAEGNQGQQTGMEVDKAITDGDLFTCSQDFRDNAPTRMSKENQALLARVTERWLNGSEYEQEPACRTPDDMAVD